MGGGTGRQEKEWVRKQRVTRTGHMYEGGRYDERRGDQKDKKREGGKEGGGAKPGMKEGMGR